MVGCPNRCGRKCMMTDIQAQLAWASVCLQLLKLKWEPDSRGRKPCCAANAASKHFSSTIRLGIRLALEWTSKSREEATHWRCIQLGLHRICTLQAFILPDHGMQTALPQLSPRYSPSALDAQQPTSNHFFLYHLFSLPNLQRFPFNQECQVSQLSLFLSLSLVRFGVVSGDAL
jgi:hypothetical protein